eukprot:Opistho-1_new@5679
MDLGISGRTTGATKLAAVRPPARVGSNPRLTSSSSVGSVRSSSASSRSTSSRVSSGQSSGLSAAADGLAARVVRPTEWTPEVEEAFRLQCAGWRTIDEYRLLKKCEPERWEESGRIKKLSVKGTTHWNYFSRDRECTSSNIGKVKLYG